MGQDDAQHASRIAAFRGGMRARLNWADQENLLNCVGCGRCGTLCTWSLVGGTQPFARSQDIRDALDATEPRAVRRAGTAQVLAALSALSEKVFGSCTMCGRCNLACGYGINQRRLTFSARGALLDAGLAPSWASRISVNARSHGHTFGRTGDEVWSDLLARARGLGEIPMDEQAEWLAVCSAIANTRIPDIVVKSIYLLRNAGISFTTSRGLTDTGTESHTAAHDAVASAAYADRLIAAAKRLGCSSLIAGECGCDVWWFLIGGAEKFRAAGLKVATFDQLMLDAIRKGRLRPCRLDRTVTFHDPCWSGRLTGEYETPREILGRCVSRIVELEPNRLKSYCCNGGGGMAHAHPADDPHEVANLRRRASAIKAEQLCRAIAEGATQVVTSCASCYLSLDDTVKHYNLPIEVTMLNLLLMEATRGSS